MNTDEHPCTEVDDPVVINRMQQFHSTMSALQNVLCQICLERFLSSSTTVPTICNRCRADSELPKLYSVDNNMDPGPLPPELCVSYINVYLAVLYYFAIGTFSN